MIGREIGDEAMINLKKEAGRGMVGEKQYVS